MNEEDYGTCEACQRLVNAGIVLETERYWAQQTPDDDYVIGDRSSILLAYSWYPAPSMAEVWTELPDEIDTYWLTLECDLEGNVAGYKRGGNWFVNRENRNPTDSLIDLLVWVTKTDGKRYEEFPSKTATEIDLKEGGLRNERSNNTYL